MVGTKTRNVWTVEKSKVSNARRGYVHDVNSTQMDDFRYSYIKP